MRLLPSNQNSGAHLMLLVANAAQDCRAALTSTFSLPIETAMREARNRISDTSGSAFQHRYCSLPMAQGTQPYSQLLPHGVKRRQILFDSLIFWHQILKARRAVRAYFSEHRPSSQNA